MVGTVESTPQPSDTISSMHNTLLSSPALEVIDPLLNLQNDLPPAADSARLIDIYSLRERYMSTTLVSSCSSAIADYMDIPTRH